MIIAGNNSSQRIFQGQRKDFIVMRKDTFEYTGTYTYIHTDGASVEYDFTDCIGMMHIKKKKTDTTPVKVIGISFDEYEYSLTADAEDMDLDAGKYHYDLQIYDADGKMVTKLYGNFIVLQDVTDFEDIVEVEYLDQFSSEFSTEIMPREKITVLLSNTVVAEVLAYAKAGYSVIFGSSLELAEYITIVFDTIFKGAVSIETQMVTGSNVVFTSTLEITTYYQYQNSNLFTSSVLVYEFATETSKST